MIGYETCTSLVRVYTTTKTSPVEIFKHEYKKWHVLVRGVFRRPSFLNNLKPSYKKLDLWRIPTRSKTKKTPKVRRCPPSQPAFHTRPTRSIKTTPMWKQGSVLHICIKNVALMFVIIMSLLLWIFFLHCLLENRPQNSRNTIRVLKI